MNAPAGPLDVHVRRAALPGPLEALRRLADRRHAFLRFAAGPGFRGLPWSFLAVDPEEILAVGPDWPIDRSLAEVLAVLRPRGYRTLGSFPPWGGGWAGTIGYEARSGVERSPRGRRPPLGLPVVWLGRYPAVLAWNHQVGRAYAAGRGPAEVEALLAKLDVDPAPGPGLGVGPVRALTPREAYVAQVEAARAAVREGEIFQTNLSHRFEAAFRGRPLDLFTRFARLQAAPYMTFLDLGDGQAVLSGSPERFVRVVGDVVETDPMKGTRPRGATEAEDRRLAAEIAASEKERAELAMIVDLSRNDVGRVCRPGTVRVKVARRILPFPRVHQAIGVVTGRLEPGRDRVDLLQAAFPPGSVTGAPKIRAMEILDALEGEGRGPYCGALGWFDDGGDADLAVGIRTIVVGEGTASWRVGAGITLRSEAQAEWEETLTKGEALALALGDDA